MKALRRTALLILAISFLAMFTSVPARADLLISLGSVSATPGSTGNGFDVELTNTGTSDVTIAAFSFEVLASSPDVTFTEANLSTLAPYIFAGDSFVESILGSPVISTSVGNTVVASDLELSGAGVSVASGATVGLGHVLFDMGVGATGPITLSLDPLVTGLSDPVGGSPVSTVSSGDVLLPVPEAPGVPFGIALLLISAVAWRSRSNPAKASSN